MAMQQLPASILTATRTSFLAVVPKLFLKTLSHLLTTQEILPGHKNVSFKPNDNTA